MKRLKGIIHVGANTGGERREYAGYGLNVLWIEPIPWIFEGLKEAISPYPNQRALQYLVLDKDGEARTLHVANNEGASSSVLSLALHQEVWPSVHFTHDLEIQSHTLDTIMDIEHINLADYDGLVLDTQGAELMVLNGARRVLRNMQMVRVEVADFEAYVGCPNPEQIGCFLESFGLKESTRVSFPVLRSGGSYYDIAYVKNEVWFR